MLCSLASGFRGKTANQVKTDHQLTKLNSHIALFSLQILLRVLGKTFFSPQVVVGLA